MDEIRLISDNFRGLDKTATSFLLFKTRLLISDIGTDMLTLPRVIGCEDQREAADAIDLTDIHWAVAGGETRPSVRTVLPEWNRNRSQPDNRRTQVCLRAP